MEMGDGRLFHAWAQSGELPFIKSLMARGCWSWLDTTADVLHISAWPSIYTGAMPGEHGVYFTFQPAPGLQGYQRFHQGIYGQPTFWQLLDQSGKRCSVLDPPYTHPEEGFAGTFIHDWGSWAHYLDSGSVPADALARMQRSCGGYPLGMEAHDHGWRPLEPRATSARLVTAVRSKTDAILWLLRDTDCDLSFAVFGETHVAGHYCLLPGPFDDASAQGPLLDLYRELDHGLAKIHAAAGDEATFIVLSGDALARNHAGWHLLAGILARLGYLADGSQQLPGAGSAAMPARSRDPVKLLRDLLPKDFRKSLAGLLPTALRDKLAQRVDNAGVDWSRTRAYCLPTDLEGYIRVNLRGREPEGIVEPGAEYNALLDDLATALGELRDDSGNQIVQEVVRCDDAFPGKRRPYLPDLVVRWNPERPIACACSQRLVRLTESSPDPRPGTHAGPGFALAMGPGIAAGQVGGRGHIVDIAPTLLARLAVPVPPHMRGRIWPEWSLLQSSRSPRT
jgi:predicted AlkP superfamily phosphohydrolase/phosphomutase